MDGTKIFVGVVAALRFHYLNCQQKLKSSKVILDYANVGVGQLLPKNKKYLSGHRIFQKIKCACGCGGDTYKRETAKNKELVIYINGHDANKNATQRESIQRYLRGLSKEELTARMKRSTGKGDNAVRIANIKRGKGSQLRISYSDGKSQDFWSYDDIESLTGFTYDQIKYRIKRHNGVLQNGNVVCFLTQYSPKINTV